MNNDATYTWRQSADKAPTRVNHDIAIELVGIEVSQIIEKLI